MKLKYALFSILTMVPLLAAAQSPQTYQVFNSLGGKTPITISNTNNTLPSATGAAPVPGALSCFQDGNFSIGSCTSLPVGLQRVFGVTTSPQTAAAGQLFGTNDISNGSNNGTLQLFAPATSSIPSPTQFGMVMSGAPSAIHQGNFCFNYPTTGSFTMPFSTVDIGQSCYPITPFFDSIAGVIWNGRTILPYASSPNIASHSFYMGQVEAHGQVRLDIVQAGTPTQWAASTVYAPGAQVYNGTYLYTTTAGGTSGSTAPITFPSANDGGVAWTLNTTCAPWPEAAGCYFYPLAMAGDLVLTPRDGDGLVIANMLTPISWTGVYLPPPVSSATYMIDAVNINSTNISAIGSNNLANNLVRITYTTAPNLATGDQVMLLNTVCTALTPSLNPQVNHYIVQVVDANNADIVASVVNGAITAPPTWTNGDGCLMTPSASVKTTMAYTSLKNVSFTNGHTFDPNTAIEVDTSTPTNTVVGAATMVGGVWTIATSLYNQVESACRSVFTANRTEATTGSFNEVNTETRCPFIYMTSRAAQSSLGGATRGVRWAVKGNVFNTNGSANNVLTTAGFAPCGSAACTGGTPTASSGNAADTYLVGGSTIPQAFIAQGLKTGLTEGLNYCSIMSNPTLNGVTYTSADVALDCYVPR